MFEYPSNIKRKFYQAECNFNNFEKLTENDIEEIKDLIGKATLHNVNDTRFDLYLNILYYLSTSGVYNNFDKNVAYLIESMDPNLITFFEYINANIITKKDILNADESEREKLINQRNYQIQSYENRVREQLGFYDNKLAKYEQKYYYKFYKKNKVNKSK